MVATSPLLNRQRLRQILVTLGGVLGISIVLGVNLLLPNPASHKQTLQAAGCLPYFLIPRELVCDKVVIYRNPDGSKVNIGKIGAFSPMPRPPAH